MGTELEFPPAPIDVTNIDAALSFGWMPDEVGAAEWAACRLADAYEELGAEQAEIEHYVERVKTWAAERMHTTRVMTMVKRVRFFEDALKRYALTLREEAGLDHEGKPKLATVMLPTAKISTRAGAAEHYEWTVLNDEALLAWCEDNAPEAVVRTVDLDALGELRVVEHDNEEGTISMVINAQGERIPGIGHRVIEAKPPTATVKVVGQ